MGKLSDLMEKTLSLKSGTIVLGEDRIFIRDGFRAQKIMLQIIAVFWLAMSIIYLYRYSKGNDGFYLWAGLLLGVMNIIVLALFSRLSSQAEILHTDIQEIQLKKRLGGINLVLKLNNNLHRQVSKVEHLTEEIKVYCQEYQLPIAS